MKCESSTRLLLGKIHGQREAALHTEREPLAGVLGGSLSCEGCGKEIGGDGERCQLRAPATRYRRIFEIENDGMNPENNFDLRTNTT